MSSNHRVAIVGSCRIPFARSFTAYKQETNQDLMTAVLRTLVHKFNLSKVIIDDVSLGAVMKHARDWNMARECVLGSGLPAESPAYDLQRACGTSLEAALQIANKIRLGQISTGIAGGVDTNSDLPLEVQPRLSQRLMDMRQAKSLGARLSAWRGFSFAELKPVAPWVVEPRTGLSMGEHCELMAKEWNVSRKEQDELAYESHRRGAKAYQDGFYNDLVEDFKGLKRDSILRADSTIEKLGQLKPAFDRSSAGTLTAGNSTPLTDGAAAVLMASEEEAKKRGWPILAYFVDAQVAAVDFVGKKEGLLMAPAYAVPQMLQRNNLSLQDFDFYEIHEAFAAQVLCTLKAWESEAFCSQKLGLSKKLGSIDRSKLNVNGGSVALGHPFAATGARILGTLAKQLSLSSGATRGLISVCTGGGMGVTAILDR